MFLLLLLDAFQEKDEMLPLRYHVHIGNEGLSRDRALKIKVH